MKLIFIYIFEFTFYLAIHSNISSRVFILSLHYLIIFNQVLVVIFLICPVLSKHVPTEIQSLSILQYSRLVVASLATCIDFIKLITVVLYMSFEFIEINTFLLNVGFDLIDLTLYCFNRPVCIVIHTI